MASDPVSAFGGIVALNQPIDRAAAEEITKIFTEVVIAPDAHGRSESDLCSEEKSAAVADRWSRGFARAGLLVKSVAGGFLVQSRDARNADDLDLKVVTKREPTAAELSDMKFAFNVAKHVKSNAIVYAKDGATVGIGAGQMSRVDSARIAPGRRPRPRKREGWTRR